MVYLPTGRSDVILILSCMTWNFLPKSNSSPPKYRIFTSSLNQLKTTWPSSLGITSNIVNILYKNNYICYCFEAPNISLGVFVFFKSRLLCSVNLYRQCPFSAYGHSESLCDLRSVSYVIFSFFTLLGSGFAQIFRQIKKLSNINFIASRQHIKSASLRADGVAQKRLCLSSLFWRETPLIDPLKHV